MWKRESIARLSCSSPRSISPTAVIQFPYSLHRDLDPQFPSETVRYDLLAYSYQFEIMGNPPLRTSLFVLPAYWKL